MLIAKNPTILSGCCKTVRSRRKIIYLLSEWDSPADFCSLLSLEIFSCDCWGVTDGDWSLPPDVSLFRQWLSWLSFNSDTCIDRLSIMADSLMAGHCGSAVSSNRLYTHTKTVWIELTNTESDWLLMKRGDEANMFSQLAYRNVL